ncbi:MAG TPA: ATPase, partial [Lachnospiraceae bacterium]|nr:ATPase [Lachnospiraceae bacterium]
MYIKRHAEKTISTLAKMFGAVMVTGPRQVGKTTMLKETVKDVDYVTLDDPILKMTAQENSNTFLKDNPPPVFIDEIQYAPNLFPYIKMYIDQNNDKGQFYLSGSQQFKLMKNVSETLAGRMGIVNLLGLSMREKYDCDFDEPFITTDEFFSKRRKSVKPFT